MSAPHDDEVLGRAYDARIMRRLVAYLRPYWGAMGVAIAAMICGTGSALLQPYLVKIAIDGHIATRQFEGLGLLAVGYVAVLVVAFAWFEWRVRMGKARGRAVYVFPLLCAAGGVLLLTHSHAIANVKEQLLIEITHTPLALAGIAAGWARWIEMRIDRDSHPVVWRAAGWIWPACILFCGLLLTIYREA